MTLLIGVVIIICGLLASLWGIRSTRFDDPFWVDGVRFIAYLGGAMIAAGGVAIIVESLAR